MKKLTIAFAIVIIAALAGGLLFRDLAPPGERVTVVHWSNGHLIRTGSGLRLLPQMIDEFNKARHTTASGERIEVKVHYYGSWEQAADLLARATNGIPQDRKIPDPTIVTPSAAHWLIRVNHEAGRMVVDPGSARSIARAMIGIVTYKDMAECLGWPDTELGYADIVALRNDPRGWGSYPCAKAEWGQRPLVAYTDPTTSSTGRSVLFSLYAIAAGKTPDELTVADVNDGAVVGYVKEFQNLVDHYMISTRPLLTKIHQGPRYGHFFLMPEDNLIHLYEGTESVFVGGLKVTPPPLESAMVMIYPKEGTMARNNCACVVDAAWVSRKQAEGAERWIDFIREEEQQRSFMVAGFRPGTDLPPEHPVSARYGLDPREPPIVYRPETLDPEVAVAIDRSWVDVKRPGIVSFVVDVSGSMNGPKLKQAREGMIGALDAMARNNLVGFITFSSEVHESLPVEPLSMNRFQIAEAAIRMRADGGTALYDAIKAGIEMSDAAPGDENAIRGVVVLTDGLATGGETRLDEIITIMTSGEVAVEEFSGFEQEKIGRDARGRNVSVAHMIGTGLAIETRNPIQIFFIGIGQGANMGVGRLLAQASGAEFQGVAEKDLAEVLEEYSKYF